MKSPHSRTVLRWVAGTAVILACIVGSVCLTTGKSKLSSGGFLPDHGYAHNASQQLESTFHLGPPNLLIDLRTEGGVDSSEARTIAHHIRTVVAEHVLAPSVLSYWDTRPPLPLLRSTDGDGGLIAALIPGDPDEVADLTPKLVAAIHQVVPADASVNLGGQAVVLDAISARAQHDLVRAEAIVIPITLIVVLWVFGSLSLALVPVIGAAITGFIAFGIVGLLAAKVSVSVFALNIISALALGLSIDYSLLLVSRYHFARKSGVSQDAAVTAALRSARHIIVTAAMLMSLCMACLLIVNLQFLRSIACAGICVIAAAAGVSLLISPAFLRWAGRLEDRTRLRKVNLSDPGVVSGSIVRAALKRPKVATVVTIGILILLIAPFLSVNFAPLDDRALATSSDAFQQSQNLREAYPKFANEPLYLSSPDPNDLDAVISQVQHANQGSHLDAITAHTITLHGRQVPADFRALISPDGDRAGILLPDNSFSPAQLMKLAEQVKRIASDHRTVVSGTYISEIDKQHAIFSRLPSLVALLTVAVLGAVFALTRALVVAVKTVVLGYASLAAGFGAMVWIFQDGHFAHVLKFQPTGSVDATGPLLLLILALGLSLDYQVILLGRVADEYRQCGDTARAIKSSVDSTARILAAAALLVSVVFIAIGVTGVTLVKIIGIGLALALVVDSILIRMVLVPSLMSLLGKYNWWPRIDTNEKVVVTK